MRLVLLALTLSHHYYIYLSMSKKSDDYSPTCQTRFFYVQTVAYIFPLIILACYYKRRTDHEKQVTLAAITYLVLFLALAASGYSMGPAIVVAPLFIP
jgi:hypothetical protein